MTQSNQDLINALQSLCNQVADAVGTINEFVHMPCKSLEEKLPTTAIRLAKARIKAIETITKENEDQGKNEKLISELLEALELAKERIIEVKATARGDDVVMNKINAAIAKATGAK